MKEMIEGHICNSPYIDAKRNGYIKTWPSVVCSQCMMHNAVEVVMSKEDVDEHNSKLRKQRSQNSPE